VVCYSHFLQPYCTFTVIFQGGSDDFAVHIYVPHDGSDMTWHEKASVANILPLLGDAEPRSAPFPSLPRVWLTSRGLFRMEKLAKLATPPACISMKDVPELENWVHDSGRMVLVGDAAHPLPVSTPLAPAFSVSLAYKETKFSTPRSQPGVIQNVAMAIEDAAVLGKIFSHLLREDQISTFLYAFQDIRQDRVAQMLRNENFNIEYMTLPECEQQQLRDNGTRMLSKQGVNVMKVGEVEEHWEDIKTTFAYDCEDEADNW
jgi:salicylate hydroxylase